MQGRIRIALIAACSGMVLAGATAAWQKDFGSWTEKDAQALVNHSPWAKQTVMPISGRPDMTVLESQEGSGGATSSASLGNPANTTSPSNPGTAESRNETSGTRTSNAKTPSGVNPSPGAPEMQPVVTILWASAAPVRLALLKLHGGGTPPTSEQISNALKPRSTYVIAVSGFAAPENGSDPKSLASGAFLTVHGKAAVVSTDSDYRKIGNSDVYFFRFPRAGLDISPDDQQVEFRLKMGKIDIKKKFELGSMMYQGQLAL
ncbi:MAG TPA: hypothetical protein VK604_23620 [Bryobacteraceae bacterium]|nr:hypothetical protein [Bryobacteraceae bacterium]